MDKSVSKDTLLRKADALLSEARRSRKSATVSAEVDRVRLVERAEDLERQAARLEKDAVSAKNGVFGPPPLQTGMAKARAGGAAGTRTFAPVAEELEGAGSLGSGRRR
jgi:hypothetical protein